MDSVNRVHCIWSKFNLYNEQRTVYIRTGNVPYMVLLSSIVFNDQKKQMPHSGAQQFIKDDGYVLSVSARNFAENQGFLRIAFWNSSISSCVTSWKVIPFVVSEIESGLER